MLVLVALATLVFVPAPKTVPLSRKSSQERVLAALSVALKVKSGLGSVVLRVLLSGDSRFIMGGVESTITISELFCGVPFTTPSYGVICTFT